MAGGMTGDLSWRDGCVLQAGTGTPAERTRNKERTERGAVRQQEREPETARQAASGTMRLRFHQLGRGHGRAGMEPIGGGLGLGRGGEQGAFVGSKDFQPMREVGGMVGAGFVRDSQLLRTETWPRNPDRKVDDPIAIK